MNTHNAPTNIRLPRHLRNGALAIAAAAALALTGCSRNGADTPPPPTAEASAPLPPVAVAPVAPPPATTTVVTPAPSRTVVAQADTRRDDRAYERRHEREERNERALPPRSDRDSDVAPRRDHDRDRQVAAVACPNCGVIESYDSVKVQGQTNGVGAVAGGVGGAVLGNRIAGRDNHTLGGIVGAVGGGLLGNAIEKHERASVAYDVHVRMNDGTLRTVRQTAEPSVGMKVLVESDGLHART